MFENGVLLCGRLRGRVSLSRIPTNLSQKGKHSAVFSAVCTAVRSVMSTEVCSATWISVCFDVWIVVCCAVCSVVQFSAV